MTDLRRHAAAIAPTVPAEKNGPTSTGLSRITGEAWRLLRTWNTRYRERRELGRLSDRDTADFCPKVTDAKQEARKPFWQP
jgi:uncharacterized protein YjiS (DUF1127 family)